MIRYLNNTERDLSVFIAYLHEVDFDFGVPLSQKVNIETFARKMLLNGNVIVFEEQEQIWGLIGFYANDKVCGIANIPILSTKKIGRGKGIGRKLLDEAIRQCGILGMKSMQCDSINPIAVRLYESRNFNVIKNEIVGDNLKSFLELKL